jgi:hypothetical protein
VGRIETVLPPDVYNVEISNGFHGLEMVYGEPRMAKSRHNRRAFSIPVAVWIATLAFGLAPTTCIAVQDQVEDDVDFRAQIWPILQAHCIECHGPQKQKGELRLDSKEFVAIGGHTGNTIIGDRPETS